MQILNKKKNGYPMFFPRKILKQAIFHITFFMLNKKKNEHESLKPIVGKVLVG